MNEPLDVPCPHDPNGPCGCGQPRSTKVTEYLEFVEVGDTGKTKVWDVMSRSGGYRLAQIRWHGPWRQYTLRPEPDTIWNTACLNDINAFILEQHIARKAARA